METGRNGRANVPLQKWTEALLAAVGPASELLSRSDLDRAFADQAVAAEHRAARSPEAVILDRDRNRLLLVKIAEFSGPLAIVTAEAWRSQFDWWRGSLLMVTAYRSRLDLRRSGLLPAWGSLAWFANEPDHVIAFG